MAFKRMLGCYDAPNKLITHGIMGFELNSKGLVVGRNKKAHLFSHRLKWGLIKKQITSNKSIRFVDYCIRRINCRYISLYIDSIFNWWFKKIKKVVLIKNDVRRWARVSSLRPLVKNSLCLGKVLYLRIGGASSFLLLIFKIGG
ncbi:MAG: hypothetical protein QXT53_07715 [Ignisphaera sp.]